MATAAGSPWAIARVSRGVSDDAFHVAPVVTIRPGSTRWRRVAALDDKIQAVLAPGNRLYALTYAGAPNYRIVSFDARSVGLDRGTHRLFRMPWTTMVREEVKLPYGGSVRTLIAEPDYPAVMVTAGLNDPRVPVWQPAKFAARLQALGRSRPVLVRIEADAGHGIGSTQSQREEEFADFYAFALWQSGLRVE